MSLFVKLATSALTDPKLLVAGPEGFTLWAKGLLWSKEHLTDGFVPEAVLPILAIGISDLNATIDKLIRCGLWLQVEGGYTVGEERWSRHQQTSDQVEEKREQGRERQRRHRDRLKAAAVEVTDNTFSRNGVSNALVTKAEPEPEPEYRAITTPLPPAFSADPAPVAQPPEVVVAVTASPPDPVPRFELQRAIDELYELFHPHRRGPSPSRDKSWIKACLIGCGTVSPEAHFQRVKEGVLRLNLCIESGYGNDETGKCILPGYEKFFDPVKGQWRDEWLPLEAAKPPPTAGPRLPLFDPSGKELYVAADEIEKLLAEGWSRDDPKRKLKPSRAMPAMAVGDG